MTTPTTPAPPSDELRMKGPYRDDAGRVLDADGQLIVDTCADVVRYSYEISAVVLDARGRWIAEAMNAYEKQQQRITVCSKCGVGYGRQRSSLCKKGTSELHDWINVIQEQANNE